MKPSPSPDPKRKAPKLPEAENAQQAGVSDVAVWGDIDTSNDYPPGTFFELPDGEQVDMNTVPDFIGGKAQPMEQQPPPRPYQQRQQGQQPPGQQAPADGQQ